MSDMMTFPETWEEYEKQYGFTDDEEVYTNGSRLIPSFRVKQWLDHLPFAAPEPKKGEWINKEFYGIGEGSAECSICHKRSSGYKEDDGWGVHCLFHDFCPNCGSYNGGEQDG